MDLNDGQLHEVPWDPPCRLEAGDVLGWSADCQTAGVYRDGQLVEVWVLRDGAMRPVSGDFR